MATISEALAIAIQHHQAGRLQSAEQIYRQILAKDSTHADAWHLLGFIAHQVGKHELAVRYIQYAIHLAGNQAGFHHNLGDAYRALVQTADAIACYRRALQLQPDLVESQNNLGLALQSLGKLDEAAACYRRALELRPDDVGVQWHQALLSLLTGDFQRGWAGYAQGWKAKKRQWRDFSQPLWDGRPLEGKTILLHAEQGLGDTIQFIRYAARVKQAGANVIVECQQPLLRLLAGCRSVDGLIGRGDDLPAFDTHSPLLSLPGIFHTSLETIPAGAAYLFAEPGLVEHWRGELSAMAGSRIGIVWRGNPKHANDRDRRLPLSCFEPLARLPGVRLFSLQKEAGAEELREPRNQFPITELGSRLDDFADTAAVLKNLDLLITCDTAVAHLAGALGVPVWVAIPLVPDWRWLLDRSDSPWYPTMRLFRQTRRGDWQGVFQKIEVALGTQMANRV